MPKVDWGDLAFLRGTVGSPWSARWMVWEVRHLIVDVSFTNCFFSVHEGTCQLPGWAVGGLVGAVVFLFLALFCCVCCCGLRRRRRAMLGASGSDLVMFG